MHVLAIRGLRQMCIFDVLGEFRGISGGWALVSLVFCSCDIPCYSIKVIKRYEKVNSGVSKPRWKVFLLNIYRKS